jgi:hypothetical protein
VCANCHYEIHWTDTSSRERNVQRAMKILMFLNAQAKKSKGKGFADLFPRSRPKARRQPLSF